MNFNQPNLAQCIETSTESELDHLDFGVIGFDAQTIVHLYNHHESVSSGMSTGRVVGQPLFTIVAPCMNNFMVAQRFEDATSVETPLDVVIDYVLTLRMRPIKVKLRLLSSPGMALRYVLVDRAV